MTPTWYDLLGVDPDASVEEIRAAWKTGIADLDPGDRRFRSLNEAAEVLLDPDRRAAYDATLEPEPEPEEPADPTGAVSGPDSPGSETVPAHGPRPTKSAVPAWLLAGLAVLVAVLLAAAGYLFTQPSDDDIADASTQAQAAAERAVTTVLAYDYRHMDEDQKASDALLTDSYRKDFDELFEVLKQNQPTTKTTVTVSKVVASGLVRSGDDRVQVLVFVNRLKTNAKTTEPEESRDQAVVTMQRSGDDWLVDSIETNGPAA